MARSSDRAVRPPQRRRGRHHPADPHRRQGMGVEGRGPRHVGLRADAVQRAWNDPARMIGVSEIRAEALGAFGDPALGRVRFEDWIHRVYVVNGSALVEINQKFHGWGRDHHYGTSGCSGAAAGGGGCCDTTSAPAAVRTPLTFRPRDEGGLDDARGTARNDPGAVQGANAPRGARGAPQEHRRPSRLRDHAPRRQGRLARPRLHAAQCRRSAGEPRELRARGPVVLSFYRGRW